MSGIDIKKTVSIPELDTESVITQNVTELVQVVLPRKDWPIGQHLRQDATY